MVASRARGQCTKRACTWLRDGQRRRAYKSRKQATKEQCIFYALVYVVGDGWPYAEHSLMEMHEAKKKSIATIRPIQDVLNMILYLLWQRTVISAIWTGAQQRKRNNRISCGACLRQTKTTHSLRCSLAYLSVRCSVRESFHITLSRRSLTYASHLQTYKSNKII